MTDFSIFMVIVISLIVVLNAWYVAIWIFHKLPLRVIFNATIAAWGVFMILQILHYNGVIE